MHFCDGFGEVINRLRDRLTAWKARSLSIRGRLTLIKSVLGSIPIYFLSLFKAPVKVINLLESIRSQFFWGFKENQGGISWVKWGSILLSRNMGGLGMGSLFAKNLSLISKWKWRFLTKENALWRKVIKAFYGVDGGFNLHPSLIGGRGVWCDIIKSILYIESIDPSFNDSFIIKWELEVELFLLAYLVWFPPRGRALDDLDDMVLLISNLSLSDIEDKWSWSRDASGSFKVKIPRKVNICVWRASINRLATRTNLAMRGIDIPSTLFPLCESAEESIEHCLISCSRVLPIWRKVLELVAARSPGLVPSFSKLA
ncbi:reverse transcriptase domain, reverse transcriptase zinc-binding domain protein [Tanacetum coccineum]